MRNWLQLIRWQNLLLIILTQFLIYYKLFSSISTSNSIVFYDVCLFIICTIIIAISGFVINDICDIPNDFINKSSNKWIIGNTINIPDAITFYYSISLIGGIIAMYLSIKYEFYYSYLLYPISVYLFWIYSKYLKCSSFFGNIFVSLFISGVVLIMAFLFSAELELLKVSDFHKCTMIWQKIIVLSIFAFLANMFREIIKDIEDEYGDKIAGCKTSPVRFGINFCKWVGVCVLVVLLKFGIGQLILMENDFSKVAFFIVIIFPPIGLGYMLLVKKRYYISTISNVTKIYMAMGLLYLILT